MGFSGCMSDRHLMSKTKLLNHLPLWHDGLDYELWSETDLGLNLNSATYQPHDFGQVAQHLKLL